MKAKIKATGQVFELCPYVYDIDGNDFLLEEIELLDNPNWQQVRIQAAIAAMQGIVSSHEARITAKSMADKTNSSPSEIIAMCAVSMADELIKELKSNVDAYAEGQKQTAINESAICNLIAELQKKGGQNDNNH